MVPSLFLAVLVAIVALPLTRAWTRGSLRASAPWSRRLARPGVALAVSFGSNALLLALVLGLTIGLSWLLSLYDAADTLQKIGGHLFTGTILLSPVLAVLLWGWLGAVLPQSGPVRWGVALAGMLPYLTLAIGAGWRNAHLVSTGPGDDVFMAGLGLLIVTVGGLMATVCGTLVIGLTRPKTFTGPR